MKTNSVLVLSLFILFCQAVAWAQPPPDVAGDPVDQVPILPNKQVSEYLDRQDESILQRHRPFYFAYGDPYSKLQLSFKSPIIHGVPLYFAYTQSMFWKLLEESKPFEDLTFNPELFYRWNFERGGLESIDFGLFSHASNGKQGEDSRSMDMNYVRFNFGFEGRRWLTRFGFDISALTDTDDTNRDIYDFIGPLGLHLSFVQLFESSYFDKSEIGFDAIPGGKYAGDWKRGGYQLTWSFRLGNIKVVPAFYLQYYTGYGETLLYYDKATTAFRGGVIF